jgi:excinuclease ABC subunit B
VQQQHNREHGITPKTIYKSVEDVLSSTRVADVRADKYGKDKQRAVPDNEWKKMTPLEREEMLDRMEKEMLDAAKNLEFERAAMLRDEVDRLKSGNKKGSPRLYQAEADE